MSSYPFPSIRINGREVYIQDIINGSTSPATDFETNTFSFIRDWLRDKNVFEIQTSGSTGTPKKLILTRNQMIASARMTEQALSLKPGDTALVCLNTQYIAGRMMLVRCMTTGMRIIATDPTANPLAYSPPGISIDFTAWVPYQLYDVLSSDNASALNSIRCIIIGGAPLNIDTIQKLQGYTCRFYATYGMTETISHIALQALNGTQASPVFKALPGITLGVDAKGCLVIKAPPIIEEEIVTNDLVDLKDDNSFVWLGRWDNVINTGGIKIIPEYLESKVNNVLYNCGILRPFFIGSVPDEKLGQKIVLILEGEELNEKKKQEINKEFKQSFSNYEIPKEILTVLKFNYTRTRKIDRRKTIEMLTKPM